MEDFFSSDDEYCYSDRDSLDGLENDDSGPQWAPPKGPTSKVFPFSFISFIFFLGFWVGGVLRQWKQILDIIV